MSKLKRVEAEMENFLKFHDDELKSRHPICEISIYVNSIWQGFSSFSVIENFF